MRPQRGVGMSGEVPIDEAANTAILLEQHIQEKLAYALADFMFGDTVASKGSVHHAVDSGNMPHAALIVRRELAQQIVHCDVFKNSLNYMVKAAIREEVETIRRLVREEFARGIIHNTYNSNRSG